MESLALEVAPFGFRTMLVGPGFFRTELLTPGSTKYAASSIEDYAERTEQTVTAWKGMNGQQGGDPAKLADAYRLVLEAGRRRSGRTVRACFFRCCSTTCGSHPRLVGHHELHRSAGSDAGFVGVYGDRWPLSHRPTHQVQLD